ncbi:cyclin-dependent protein kinase inhibitor SMR3-like [Prosopis cineraria]|uniref:cyclin-dependent protein kinase inhibitor SMR3-like n=1 Tax=Prosopis cineraria TaxID=364024 RepID=UPI00240FDD38|nr:cyclin-dependent protein kinase inhibitor SMR3-like [Prosopis cineraria]
MFSFLLFHRFMIVPNSQVFLSHKHLCDMERFDVLLRSSPDETVPGPSEDADPHQNRNDKRRRPSLPLRIKIPTTSSFEEEGRDEGFKTPTSAIHKISEIPQCPPAPRKPKSFPSRKRRASRPVILLDLSREIDSLFPGSVVFDFGGQIKKVKS